MRINVLGVTINPQKRSIKKLVEQDIWPTDIVGIILQGELMIFEQGNSLDMKNLEYGSK